MTDTSENISPTIRPSKCLVCVDGSDASRMALRFACLKAKKRGLLIDIVYVIPPSDMQALGAVKEKMMEEQREEAAEMLKAFVRDVENTLQISPNVIIREGIIQEEILEQANEDEETNILVLGVTAGKGHGKVVSWLMQQMGEALLIPMMLVPTTLTDQQMEEVV